MRRVLVLALLLSLPLANAAWQEMETPLTPGRADAAVFDDGFFIWILGGELQDGNLTDEIVRYDPHTDQATVMPERLPEPRRSMGWFYDGGRTYLIGGIGPDGAARSSIWVFDPTTGETRNDSISLPEPASEMSAAWTGRVALLYGGDPCGSCRVLRYEPGQNISAMEARLPPLTSPATMVQAGGVLVFGGAYLDAGRPATDGVWRHDLANDTITKTELLLPQPSRSPTALYDGRFGIVLTDGRGIVRYDPLTETLDVMHPEAPWPTAGSRLVRTQDDFYVVGAGPDHDRILRLNATQLQVVIEHPWCDVLAREPCDIQGTTRVGWFPWAGAGLLAGFALIWLWALRPYSVRTVAPRWLALGGAGLALAAVSWFAPWATVGVAQDTATLAPMTIDAPGASDSWSDLAAAGITVPASASLDTVAAVAALLVAAVAAWLLRSGTRGGLMAAVAAPALAALAWAASTHAMLAVRDGVGLVWRWGSFAWIVAWYIWGVGVFLALRRPMEPVTSEQAQWP